MTTSETQLINRALELVRDGLRSGENPLPHDRRQEPDHSLYGLTKGEVACLADLASGRLWRFPTGYAHRNVEGEQCDRAHSVKIVWALQDKGLLRLWVTFSAGSNDRWAELMPGDGNVAWIARTAARKVGRS